MKFYTAYYRQRNAETVSLLVQQATVGRCRERVLLAGVFVAEKSECNSGAKSASMTAEFTNFFSEEVLPMVSRYSYNALGRLKKKLLKIVDSRSSVAIILSVEANAMLITYGDCDIYLLGKRFSKPYMERMKVEMGECVVLETGVRILLTTEAVEKRLPGNAIISCLGKDNITGEKQLARRLEDLGGLADLERPEDLRELTECSQDKEFAMLAICCVSEGRDAG